MVQDKVLDSYLQFHNELKYQQVRFQTAFDNLDKKLWLLNAKTVITLIRWLHHKDSGC
jgi:hypothetical protein